MNRSRLVLLCGLMAALPAQETEGADTPQAPLQSGPPAGRKLTALRTVDVAGPRTGQEYDVAAGMQKGAAAILFVHEVTRNIAPMVRAFDQIGAELLPLSLQCACIRLSADRTEAERHTPLVARSLRMRNPMMVSADGAEGPGNYALNRKATLTLVLARDGVVQKSIAYTDTGQNDVPMLRIELQGLVGIVPEDLAELAAVLERTLPSDRRELVALVTRLELDRRRLEEQIADLDRRLAEARGRGGRPMATTDAAPARGRDAAPMAGLQAAARRMAAAAATAGDIDAAMTQLDATLEKHPDLMPRARGLLERVANEAGNDAARQRAREWLDRRRQ